MYLYQYTNITRMKYFRYKILKYFNMNIERSKSFCTNFRKIQTFQLPDIFGRSIISVTLNVFYMLYYKTFKVSELLDEIWSCLVIRYFGI